MPESESSSPGKTARQRIIEDAEYRCHEVRTEVRQAIMLEKGDLPHDLKLKFQDTILNYYSALRPLRDKPAVDDWWDEVTLSEEWIVDQEEREHVEVTGSLYGGPVGAVQRTETVDVEATGLDTLEEIDCVFEEEEEEIVDAKGKRTVTHTRQKVLDPEILIDVSYVLDQAVERLGLGPDVPEQLQEVGLHE